MAIVETKRRTTFLRVCHWYRCWVPPAAATAGASAGGAWDIGDGDANADSFMYACTHVMRT